MQFEHKIIDLNNKPDEFIDLYQRASGSRRGLVPLLEHGDNLVIESDVVAKYVAQHIEGVDGKGDDMYPTEAEIEDEMLIDSFMESWKRVTDAYYDVLRSASQEEVEGSVPAFIQSLNVMEIMLQQRGDGDEGGDFLLGSKFSWAECISAPWIQRFYVTLPYFRGIDFEDAILGKFDCLPRWMGAVCNRQSCMDSKCPEEEMIAACKRYYVSFLSPGAGGRL